MPVVINEFEVVGDPPAAQRPEPAPQQPSPQTPRGATPYEVESILRREKERLARVRAH